MTRRWVGYAIRDIIMCLAVLAISGPVLGAPRGPSWTSARVVTITPSVRNRVPSSGSLPLAGHTLFTMSTPAIVPTITQRVRFFLAEQGAALRPWTGLQETFDELYALLRSRRGDPRFWGPLKTLLRDVVDDAATSQRRGQATSPAAELLDSWQVDALVDELREALPDDTTAPATCRTDFTRTLSTAVLGGFLLLGLAAVGCGSNTEDDLGTGGHSGSGGSGGQTTLVLGSGGAGGQSTTVLGSGGAGLGGTVALGTGGSGSGGAGSGGMLGSGGSGAGGCPCAGGTGGGGMGERADAATSSDLAPLDTSSIDAVSGDAQAIDSLALACTQAVAPALDQAIGESSISARDKTQLCGCFASLNASWTTSLTDLFANATPAEISKMLSGLTPCCRSTGVTTLYGGSNPSSSDLDRIKSGAGYMLCMAPSYKGVSFPD